MRVLFVCGGTGGHINPALAVAGHLKEKDPEVKILFAGSPLGMEANLVPKAGYDFAPVKVKGFQRQLSWNNIKNNLMALVYLTTSGARSRQIIKEFQPDVVMGMDRRVQFIVNSHPAVLDGFIRMARGAAQNQQSRSVRDQLVHKPALPKQPLAKREAQVR